MLNETLMFRFQIRVIGVCMCKRTFREIEGIPAVEGRGIVLIDAAVDGKKREVVGRG